MSLSICRVFEMPEIAVLRIYVYYICIYVQIFQEHAYTCPYFGKINS